MLPSVMQEGANEIILQAAFDVLAVIIAGLNSFDRPYRHRHDILRSLRMDGIMWFTVRPILYHRVPNIQGLL